MAELAIVVAQGIEMPPDILALVRQMKLVGFTLLASECHGWLAQQYVRAGK